MHHYSQFGKYVEFNWMADLIASRIVVESAVFLSSILTITNKEKQIFLYVLKHE